MYVVHHAQPVQFRPPGNQPVVECVPLSSSRTLTSPHTLVSPRTLPSPCTLTSPRKAFMKAFVAKHTCHEMISRRYEEVRVLGSGNFGSVALVKDRMTGEQRVCKVMTLAGKSHAEVTLMKSEVDMLAEMDHPQVVRLHEYAEDVARQELILIMEYIPGGSCEDLLSRKSGHLSETLVARLIHQLLIALAHCHARGIVHRDVKPENMMLTSPGHLRKPNCKLIDFGLAANESDREMRFVVGTPPYMAPEVVQFMPYSTSADMWSAGITTLKLLTGFSPFEAEGTAQSQVFEMIKRHVSFEEFGLESNPGWQRCSDDCQDFMRKLLVKDARFRPNALEALEHPWLSAHGPETRRLTNAAVQSLESYSSVSSSVRCCSLIVAAHLKPDEQFSQMFLGADVDGDGLISRDEIVDALDDVERRWWDPKVNIDVDTVMEATKMGSEGMCFTEFLAACLLVEQDKPQDLVERAFHELDSDGDGFVHSDNLRILSNSYDLQLLQRLPHDRAFNLSEWIACVQGQTLRNSTDISGSGRPLKVTQRRGRIVC